MENAQEERYRVIAALLQYPDSAWLDMIPEVAAYSRRLPAGRPRKAIDQFLNYLASQPLLRLQENYTAAFDLTPATTLNMSWHLVGDSRKRAALLARLQQGYRHAGYEGPVRDLPDFLPAMVEFLAVCRDAEILDFFRQCLAGLDGLVSRLMETAPPYAHLLDLLADDCRGGKDVSGPPGKRRDMS
jgi:nitrate reductase molybdenum cofactor assembly chaperone NarJ/NarW